MTTVATFDVHPTTYLGPDGKPTKHFFVLARYPPSAWNSVLKLSDWRLYFGDRHRLSSGVE